MKVAGVRDNVGRIDQPLELTPDAHVGSRLRARRIEVGLSQGALGRHLGITFSQVQKYEKGSNRIGAGRLYQLSALLGVSVLYFFEGLDKPRLAPSKSDPITTLEAARLQEVFVRILNKNMRQALLSLASSMAEGSPPSADAHR